METNNRVEIIDYQAIYFERWRDINEAWIKKAYVMEEIDSQHCSEPESSILANGGIILLAKIGGEIVGTAGLIKDDDETYELIKMAVDENYRGMGIGKMLCQAAIDRSKHEGAKLLYLFSNTGGSDKAIQIYYQLGFQKVPLSRNDFARADIQMEMRF